MLFIPPPPPPPVIVILEMAEPHLDVRPRVALDPLVGLEDVAWEVAMHAAEVDVQRREAAEAERRRRASTARRFVSAPPGKPPLSVVDPDCESDSYTDVSDSGKYRGRYQFDQKTWEEMGGTGDPAAAPPEEQDARAAALARKRDAWPNC